MVVPDQRKVPATAGWILKNGAVTGLGIRPSVTIGSEKTTVTSLDSPRSAVSPDGRALTTERFVWASDRDVTASDRRVEAATTIRVSMSPREGGIRVRCIDTWSRSHQMAAPTPRTVLR